MQRPPRRSRAPRFQGEREWPRVPRRTRNDWGPGSSPGVGSLGNGSSLARSGFTATTDLSADVLETMIRVRRAIHRRPELSNEELETTALIRRELAAAGLGEVREIADTGVAVDIKGAS